VIFCYHRVNDQVSDPTGLTVTPAHLDEHLEVLRRIGHPMSLRAIADALASGRPPRRGFAVTFDDGYADSLHLERVLGRRPGSFAYPYGGRNDETVQMVGELGFSRACI
jgi:peptidoglycan/xylan/chitin deacetylase (PgdA/CDA1 family)